MDINLMDFVQKYLIILVIAIYVVGIFLKQTTLVKDNYITVILMIFGITFAVLLVFVNNDYKSVLDAVINGVLQGILCWGVAVGINQTTKQLTKNE